MAKLSNLSDLTDIFREISGKAKNPDELAGAYNSLGIRSVAVSPILSARVDLNRIGLGKGIMLSHDIRERKSVYRLEIGETVMTGIFVGGDGVAYEYVTRLSGASLTAKDGDTYQLEYKGIDGKLLYSAKGDLNITDPEIGYGYLEGEDGVKLKVWVLWSCMNFED